MSLQDKVLAPIVKAGLGLLNRTRIPTMQGDLPVDRLKAPVEIVRDSWGIPHIFAKSLEDLLFAQGFIHAQERLWQMEFNRRLVAGRLSEILGGLTLPVDRWMRTLTLRRVAEAEVELLSDRVRAYLDIYTEGVNEFMKQGKLPGEFTLLRYKPEPWISADTLSWIKMMAWVLSVNWELEILRARLLSALGADVAAELELPQLDRWPYAIPRGADYQDLGLNAITKAEHAKPFAGPSPYEGLGSNNWVISGQRTTSGMPILANDMHLALSAPSIWFENHLSCPELDAIGVSFPGIPGIISGHNGHVAWGFTNGFPDVQDLYIERLRRTDDGQVQAEYNKKWEDVRVVREVIEIKGGNSALEEVLITRHGPIINSLAPDDTGETPLALRWTALEPGTMMDGLFVMLSAKNCAEFHEALRYWSVPVQNVVYADTNGDIGYIFPGKIPIRAQGDGRLPVPGWTDEYEWSGYVPFEELPHLFNPEQGYIATANYRAFDTDFPALILLDAISGDRAQRIVEMIESITSIDIEFIKQMHRDQYSPTARLFAELLAQIHLEPETDEDVKAAIEALSQWDGKLDRDSREALIYQVFMRQFVRLILEAKLGPENDLVERVMGKGPTPVLAEGSMIGEFMLPFITQLVSQPDSHWFDLGHGERRDEVICLAMRRALDELSLKIGPSSNQWRWGKLHQLTFAHVMGANPLIGAFYNRGPYEIGGDSTTVWATGTMFHEPENKNLIGPPYRMIVDLGDLGNSCSVLVPGQSGNPSSPHYDDQIDDWYEGNYHPMLYFREEIEKNASQRMRLIPK